MSKIVKSFKHLSEEGLLILDHLQGLQSEVNELKSKYFSLHGIERVLKTKTIDLQAHSENMITSLESKAETSRRCESVHIASPSTQLKFVEMACYPYRYLTLSIKIGTAAAAGETLSVNLHVAGQPLLDAPYIIDDTTINSSTNTVILLSNKPLLGDITELDLVYTPGGAPTLADVYLGILKK